MPAWQRAATLVLAVCAMATAVVLLGEAAVRIRQHMKYGDMWGIDDTYSIDARSGLRIPTPGGHFGPIIIDSRGFRSPEIAEHKAPNQLRIAFLGGSTTYCAEVSSNEMTWPYLVWKRLHEQWLSKDVDYLNAGVPGYTTKTLLRALQVRVAPLKPDVIVIYEATNDLAANSYELARQQGVAVRRQEEQLSWLSRHSLLAFLVEKNIQILRIQMRAPGKTGTMTLDAERLDDQFRRDYADLVEASGRVAKLVAAVTFSPRLRPEQSATQRREAAVTSRYYMPFMDVDDLVTAFAHYNQVIREVAVAHDALLIADENAIPADALHYVDSVHFTDSGSQSMADRVSRAMISSPAFREIVEDREAVVDRRD